MDNNASKITQKQTMLAFALKARGVNRDNCYTILMALDDDEQVDDLVWYMGENPNASEEELVAVAYQLVKEAQEGKNNG